MPPSSKHPRDDNDEVQVVSVVRATSGNKGTSLSHFQNLPDELKETVLRFACSHSSQQGRLSIDTKAALNLMLVSRSFSQMIKPFLWRHVKLVKPSALADFGRALVSQPSNGALVKSLHLGPVKDLPYQTWPHQIDQTMAPKDSDWYHGFVDEWDDGRDWYIPKIRTSLRETGLLPQWAKPGQEWANQEGREALDCQDRAVMDVIEQARWAVDIYTAHEGSRCAGAAENPIGQNEWTLGVIYLQAILDLYLCEMRRVDDAEERARQSVNSSPSDGSSAPAKKKRKPQRTTKACLGGTCGHYPQLLLDGFRGCNARHFHSADKAKRGLGRRPQKRGRSTFLITLDQVKQHLVRRGAATDHFEHPLFFTQRNLRMLYKSDRGDTQVRYHKPQPDDYHPEDRSRMEQILNHYAEDIYDADGVPLSWPRGDPPSPPFANESCEWSFNLWERNGVVALAQWILHRTPKVENLSLTGLLYECLQKELPPLLKTLRSLSIGCPTWPSNNGAFLASLELPAMKKLRFCTEMLDEGTAKLIGGQTPGWDSLKKMQWDFADSRLGPGLDTRDLVRIINILQGHQETTTTSASQAATASSSSNEVTAADEGRNGASTRRNIEVCLHHNRKDGVLNKAATPQVRAAWQNGSPIRSVGSPACHCVKIKKSNAAAKTFWSNKFGDSPRQNYELLRQGCEEWWEARAWGLDNGGRLA